MTELHGQVELVLGKSGSGKTVLIADRLLHLDRFIVWDTKPDGYDARIVGTTLWTSAREFIDSVGQTGTWGRVVIQDKDSELEPFLRWAYALGKMLIIIEEVDAFCTTNGAPPFLTEALRRGRSRGLSLILSSQRPAEIPKGLTNRADAMVLMGGTGTEPTDHKYLSQKVGLASADKVRAMPRYTFLRVPLS